MVRRGDRSNPEERTVFSTCLGCNARCGIRFHVRKDKIQSVSGNPYHPYNMLGSPLSTDAPLSEGLAASGTLCGKAQDVSSYVFNRFRILTPLKRCGKRGEGKFKPISWKQLIREIAFGGKLFEEIGEDRHVPGLNSILSDRPICEDAPELGPLRNSFCFMTGRLQTGRKEFIDRFVKYSFGSINRIGHTDICGIGFRMGNFAFTEGKAVELKADAWNSEFILIFGANIYEALQPGLNTYGATVANRHSKGEVKFCIVDPRAQRATAHAERWVPIKPGTDGAFAMGLIRWILEQEIYRREYLEAPNLKAAQELGNGGYVNASHLVIWDDEKGYDNPLHGRFLRWEHVYDDTSSGQNGAFMVFPKGKRRPVSYLTVSKADINAQAKLRLRDGSTVTVKTSFVLMKEAVFSHSLRDYATTCGVDEKTIREVAEEFARYAPRSSVCQYHGAGNYVGGTYAAYAVAVLSALTGSLESKGGYCSSGGAIGSWRNSGYNLADFPGKRKPWGVKFSREKFSYQKSSEYKRKVAKGENPYPARRPWFPFTKGGLCVEALSGIDEAYPYPCSALFLYFFNPVYSIPGGFRFKETLKDTGKVPLLVSIDIGINESNIYADYIVPDVTYAEGQYGWLSPHAPCFSFTSVRTPAIEPLTDKTSDGRPICLETFLIDLAKELGLPGFGKDSIPAPGGRLYSLDRAEDFYLRGFSNIAESAHVDEATRQELEFVEKNYPVARFKDILSKKEWARTAKLLSRGGIFKDYHSSFHGNVKKRAVQRFCLYNEELAWVTCSITGKRFSGTLSMKEGLRTSSSGFPFTLVSFKRALHTQSRTVWHKIAMELWPENFVLMNEEDAKGLNLSHLDRVLVRSPSNRKGLQGRVFLTQTLRPGVVTISISYGHTQLGASKVLVEGMPAYLSPDPRLKAGINPNNLALLDPRFNNTPFVDLVGGIPDFSSSVVSVEPLK